MRQVRVICHYIAKDPQAEISEIAIELDLNVPDGYSDEDLANAAVADAHMSVAGITEEFGVTFRPRDESEGGFVEVQNA